MENGSKDGQDRFMGVPWPLSDTNSHTFFHPKETLDYLGERIRGKEEL
jgi:hypothetical protein